MLFVDEMEFDLPCSIERKANVTSSEVSGMLLDKTYMNDVIGTYMSYNVKIAVPVGKESDYYTLYEILSDPVDAHTWILPYNGDMIELTARVSVISDRYYREENGVKIWRGTSFTITANHPSKEMQLEEVLQRGMTPVPYFTTREIGDTYYFNQNEIWELVASSPTEGQMMEYNGSTWEGAELVNLDEVAF